MSNDPVGIRLAEPYGRDVWPPDPPPAPQAVVSTRETNRRAGASCSVRTTVLHKGGERNAWRWVGAKGVMAHP